jgi:glycosyltransferase involved in cell wall biosynthesis
MKNDSSYYFETIKEQLSSYCILEKKNFGIMDIFSLKHFIISVQPQIVFSFSTTLSHYALLLKFFGAFGCRFINGSIRDAPVDLNIQLKFEELMYNFYDEVVANSKAGLKAYKQEGKRGRYILYNGLSNSRLPMKTKIELRHQLRIKDKFTVAMVASMGESKDQTTFLKAAAKVLEITDDIQFYLVGDGPKKSEYMNLVLTLELENNIYFTGEVSNAEQYLKASDLSVLMSTNAEGFPNVVLESLACGVPVIAIKDGGTKEVLKNNYNGYLINNGDYNSLAKKIILLRNNHGTLKSFSKNGMKTIMNRFFIEKMISDFEGILGSK